MSKVNAVDIAGVQVPLTSSYYEKDLPEVIRFQPFKEWVAAMSKETYAAEKKEVEIKNIEIQSVDYFGPKIGFIKFQVDARLLENGKKIPGIVFMRGGSVAVLLILRFKEDNNTMSERVVLTHQPRVAVPSLAFPELPAGMLDGSGNFTGKASEEIKEETGITISEEDLVDMTGLAYGDKYRGAYPSPGGCDEFMRLCLCVREMKKEDVEKLEGKLCGLRDHGESITVGLVKLDELWKLPDMKALSALALYEALRKDGKI